VALQNGGMSHRLTIDKSGRMILPRPLRDELRREPGDTLELQTAGEEITLRPARGNAQLRKKQGVWVFRAGEPITEEIVEKAARQVREERENQILGKDS
jgi:AbrB family looped-hinge helix DNA binding protein